MNNTNKMRKFILDEEIQLIEGTDFLNTKVYADNLISVIENAPEKKSFTIGVFGEWGTGKSSIIKTVKENLEAKEGKTIKFITYDAWKYANDSFRRMFLLCVQDNLKHTATNLINSFYLNEGEDVDIKKKFNLTNLSIIIAIFVLGAIFINFLIPFSDKTEDWKLTLNLLISLAGLISAIYLKAFDEFKVNIQKPHLFAPEQFENCFKEMVGKSLKHYNWIEKTVSYVQGENFIKNIDKIVIVIDNIDRCHKEMAYELLTNIKNFMGNLYDIIFIIPVDDSALRKHILNTSRDTENGTCDKEAEEFLRKFFNVTIRIKPYHSEEIYEFAEKINKNYSLNFSPDTINIVSKEYAKNPRRLIQLFNNLSVELCSFTKDFIKQYEPIICKLLIIREEFPDYYYRLSLNSHLLHNPKEGEITKYYESYSDLKDFLVSTRTVSQDIPSSDLEKILSNSKVFSGISEDLLNSINNIDIEAVTKFIEKDDTLKNTVIKYIIECLKKGVNRGTYDSEVIPKFNLITSINEKYQLEPDQNNRIYEVIQDISILNNIFNKIDISSTITYSNSIYKQGYTYLTNYITDRTNSEIINNNSPSDRWINILKKSIYEYSDTSVLEKLKDAFKKYYFIDHSILDFEKLSDSQIKSLFSNDLQVEIINNIISLDIDIYYLDFAYLTKHLHINENIANLFINKINTLYPDFNLKADQEINNILQIVNSCLELLNINLSNNFTEIQNLFNKFISNRKIPNPQPHLAGSRQHDQSVNFISQNINNPQIVENIIKFCCHIYRLTLNNINISGVLDQIIANHGNREMINSNLIILMNSFSLSPLFDFLITDTTYTSDSFKLLKNAFTRKKDKKYILPDDKLLVKLNEILSLIFNGDQRNQNLINYLEDLISDSRIKDSLIKIISTQSKDNILKLSIKLQTLAIDAILDGDNIFSFADNIEFLKVVAGNGEAKHILKLVNLLMTKLPNESQLKDAVSIIMEIKRLNIRDASRIKTELENYQSYDNYKEIILQAINNVEDIREDKKTVKKENG